MSTTANSLEQVIIIGNRVLIKPKKPSERTESGLYLPPSVHKKEKLHSGYVTRVGPGHPVPLPDKSDEPWKEKDEEDRYVPLQAQEGDLAVYLKKQGYELQIDKEEYVVVPHSAILLLFRDEGLFD
jgi:co-chaperonin GroES (HSP10)